MKRIRLMIAGALAVISCGTFAVIPGALASTTWREFSYQSAGGNDVFLSVDSSRHNVSEITFTVSDSAGHKADIDYDLFCYNSNFDSAHRAASYTVQVPYTRTFTSMPGGYHYYCDLDLTVSDHAFDSFDWVHVKASYAST